MFNFHPNIISSSVLVSFLGVLLSPAHLRREDMIELRVLGCTFNLTTIQFLFWRVCSEEVSSLVPNLRCESA